MPAVPTLTPAPPQWTTPIPSSDAVVVLMSTWNGALYVEAQIQSILNQQVQNAVWIFIRDDGSQDDTVQIIESMHEPRIHLWVGSNLGAKRSFFALLEAARTLPFEYFAFSDQDDVWLPTKLQAGINALKIGARALPSMYCSAVTMTDHSLKSLRIYRYKNAITLSSQLVSNCATGCTVVINRALADRIQPLPNPEVVWMHDWWLGLVATAIGSLIYDIDSHILYRQHAGNQIGLPAGLTGQLKRIWRGFAGMSGPTRISQAQALVDLYGKDLTKEQFHLMRRFLAGHKSMGARLKFAAIQWPLRGGVTFGLLARLAFVRGRH